MYYVVLYRKGNRLEHATFYDLTDASLFVTKCKESALLRIEADGSSHFQEPFKYQDLNG